MKTAFTNYLAMLVIALFSSNAMSLPQQVNITVERIGSGAIITPQLDASLGNNIQGPSVIRVPSWLKNPLGKYYLYFADHKGKYIRLAYADNLTGPWKIYQPGSLHLKDTGFPQTPMPLSAKHLAKLKAHYRKLGVDVDNFPYDPTIELTTPHIASPDVHVDDVNQRIVMYFHGLKQAGKQVSRVAFSDDGIHFNAQSQDLGKTYLRAFDYQNQHYALAMPGQFYRSENGVSNFIAGPKLFNNKMRHAGVYVNNDTLYVFWSQVGDAPESILLSTISLANKPWQQWQINNTQQVLSPEFAYEGANAPVTPSFRSKAPFGVNQLRDPYIFNDQGELYLFYTVAGESGIGLAKIAIH